MTVSERESDTAQAGDQTIPRLRALVAPVSVAAAMLGSLAYVAAVDPHAAGHYPTCPFLWLTGYYCPGCGSLRAAHDLVDGNLAGSWDMNPLFVLVVPWLVWRWLKWVLARAGHPVRTRQAPAWSLYVLAGLVVTFWIARNVPAFAPYLAP